MPELIRRPKERTLIMKKEELLVLRDQREEAAGITFDQAKDILLAIVKERRFNSHMPRLLPPNRSA